MTDIRYSAAHAGVIAPSYEKLMAVLGGLGELRKVKQSAAEQFARRIVAEVACNGNAAHNMNAPYADTPFADLRLFVRKAAEDCFVLDVTDTTSDTNRRQLEQKLRRIFGLQAGLQGLWARVPLNSPTDDTYSIDVRSVARALGSLQFRPQVLNKVLGLAYVMEEFMTCVRRRGYSELDFVRYNPPVSRVRMQFEGCQLTGARWAREVLSGKASGTPALLFYLWARREHPLCNDEAEIMATYRQQLDAHNTMQQMITALQDALR